jgi:hypothetical protein
VQAITRVALSLYLVDATLTNRVGAYISTALTTILSPVVRPYLARELPHGLLIQAAGLLFLPMLLSGSETAEATLLPSSEARKPPNSEAEALNRGALHLSTIWLLVRLRLDIMGHEMAFPTNELFGGYPPTDFFVSCFSAVQV